MGSSGSSDHGCTICDIAGLPYKPICESAFQSRSVHLMVL
jgi:hypothetical protein